MARVFSQKHSLTFVGNICINSVGTESVYQNWQSGKTECLVGVSLEGLTREILARHSCLHPVLTLRIPACANHMSYFAGCLVARNPRKLFSLQLLKSSHPLSITQPLQSNPTINTGYKRLNRITIKFGTKLKPTKHIVVNHTFTTSNKHKCLAYLLIFFLYQLSILFLLSLRRLFFGHDSIIWIWWNNEEHDSSSKSNTL